MSQKVHIICDKWIPAGVYPRESGGGDDGSVLSQKVCKFCDRVFYDIEQVFRVVEQKF